MDEQQNLNESTSLSKSKLDSSTLNTTITTLTASTQNKQQQLQLKIKSDDLLKESKEDDTENENENEIESLHENQNLKKKSTKICLKSASSSSTPNTTKCKNTTEEIKLNDLNSVNNLNNQNLDVCESNQVKINLQNDATSLQTINKKNRKKFCNLKKINRKTLKRPLPCLFAWSLLISSSGAYYAIVAPRLLELLDDLTSWIAILIAQSVIFLFVVVNFLVATLRDPGRFQKIVIAPDDPNFNDDTKSPLYKTVVIKKITVKIKWCSTCNFYRPPRVSHCSICDACIDQFDHHCPWLNNCVGFLCLHLCAIFSCCLTVALKTSPILSPPCLASICLMILIVLLIFPIGGLFLFHIVLVSKGRTTNEHVTGKYKGMNFFSRGCCLNFVYLFWGSLIPKYRTVKLKKKSLGSKSDVEMGKLRGKESSCSDNERLTVTYSNNNLGDSKGGQEQELLDLVLKTKKNFNNRKSSISSDSSLSSSMLNKSSRLNHANNVSLDSNKLSTKINELNNTSLNSNNLKSKFNNK